MHSLLIEGAKYWVHSWIKDSKTKTHFLDHFNFKWIAIFHSAPRTILSMVMMHHGTKKKRGKKTPFTNLQRKTVTNYSFNTVFFFLRSWVEKVLQFCEPLRFVWWEIALHLCRPFIRFRNSTYYFLQIAMNFKAHVFADVNVSLFCTVRVIKHFNQIETPDI